MKTPSVDCKCPQCRAAGRYSAATAVAAELDYGPTSAHRNENRDPREDDEALDEAGYAMHGNSRRYEGLTDDEGNADERLDADGGLGRHNAAAWDSDGDDELDEGDDENDLGEDDELDEGDDDDLDEEDELDEGDDEDDLGEDDELDEGDDEEATARDFEFAPDVGQFDAELDDEVLDDDEADVFDGEDLADALGGDAESLEQFDVDEDFDSLDEEDDELDVLTVRPRCPGIKRIRVRKDRDGREVLTRDQASALCAAARLARAQANNVAAAFDRIWFQRGVRKMPKRRRAWRDAGRGAVLRWFGGGILTRRQIRVTRRRVRRIKGFLTRGVTFVVIQHQSGKRSYICKGSDTRTGYAWGGSRVYLCPEFFQRDRRRQARIIIHELVHKLGWPHARLPGVGPIATLNEADRQRALRLARMRPMRARHSPVNYQWLYDEF